MVTPFQFQPLSGQGTLPAAARTRTSLRLRWPAPAGTLRAFCLLTVVLLWAGLLPVPLSGQVLNDRPEGLENVRLDQKLDAQVPPDIRLVTESGEAVPLSRFFNRKPVVLMLVYYECPMLCNLVLNGAVSAFQQLQFTVGQEFDVVTVSFDPRETPERAAAAQRTYLVRYGRPGAARGWHFLTGTEPEIARLAEAVGFGFQYDPSTRQFAHAAGIMVLTPQGRISHYFYGIEYDPQDLRLALVESSQERIGNAVDQLLLFCFHYDPTTGRFGLAVMNALRIAGTLTVLAIGGLIFFLLRRERTGATG